MVTKIIIIVQTKKFFLRFCTIINDYLFFFINIGDFFLPTVEENLPAVILGPHREVNPVGRPALLKNQFVKISLRAIRDIQQNARHPDHMLRAITLDIHRAPRQVITPLCSPTLSIHLFTSESTRNNDGDLR